MIEFITSHLSSSFLCTTYSGGFIELICTLDAFNSSADSPVRIETDDIGITFGFHSFCHFLSSDIHLFIQKISNKSKTRKNHFFFQWMKIEIILSGSRCITCKILIVCQRDALIHFLCIFLFLLSWQSQWFDKEMWCVIFRLKATKLNMFIILWEMIPQRENTIFIMKIRFVMEFIFHQLFPSHQLGKKSEIEW